MSFRYLGIELPVLKMDFNELEMSIFISNKQIFLC